MPVMRTLVVASELSVKAKFAVLASTVRARAGVPMSSEKLVPDPPEPPDPITAGVFPISWTPLAPVNWNVAPLSSVPRLKVPLLKSMRMPPPSPNAGMRMAAPLP